MRTKQFTACFLAAGLISLTACFPVQSQNSEQPRQDDGWITSPEVPSTSTSAPSGIERASPKPTTAGMPMLRARTEVWAVGPWTAS